MTIEEVIEALRGEITGAYRGPTACPGNASYEGGRAFVLRRCECSYDDADYGAHEYIASDSGNPPYCVSLNLGINERYRGRITCGDPGYHHETHSNTPACA